MKLGVSKFILMVTAGVVWVVAGINILCVGLPVWNACSQPPVLMAGVSLSVFSFFIVIFCRLWIKYIRRILRKPGEYHHPLSFFDRRGWMIMMFMIILGVVIRRFALLPDYFIAPFYVGLSAALLLMGSRFLCYGWSRRALISTCPGHVIIREKGF